MIFGPGDTADGGFIMNGRVYEYRCEHCHDDHKTNSANQMFCPKRECQEEKKRRSLERGRRRQQARRARKKTRGY